MAPITKLSLAFAGAVASAEQVQGGTLSLTWTDCGDASTHAKVTDLKPTTLEMGKDVNLIGTGSLDEDVVGGTFEIDAKAGPTTQKFTGDICEPKTFKLPLGVGTIKWDGLSCPVKKGTMSVPIDVQISAHVPASLATADISAAAVAKNGDKLICMKIHAKKEADELSENWEAFKSKFVKSYEVEEEIKRFQIYTANLAFIKAENAKNNTYVLGENEFSDLTPAEFAAMYTGLRQPKPESLFGDAPSLGFHTMVEGELLAENIDWRTKGAVTPIKNQGSCGSCWAFSAIGTLEGANQIATGSLVSLSEQQIVNCAHGSAGKPCLGCMGGNMDMGLKYATSNKVCTESSFPYRGWAGMLEGCGKVSSCEAGIAQGGVTGYKEVKHNSEQDLMSAVQQLPVSIGIEADQAVFQSYKSGVLSGACGAKTDHGVTAIGYGTDGGLDYWLVKNSWGASWGEQGTVRIKRGLPGAGECGILSQPCYPVIKSTVVV